MEKIYLVPAVGSTVIDPANGQPLPAEGKEVETSIYWLRRKNEGDVTEVVAPKKLKSTKE